MNENIEMSGEFEDLLKDELIDETGEKSGDLQEEALLDPVSQDLEVEKDLEIEKEKELSLDKKEVSTLFSDYMRQFDEESSAEGKIRLSIEFMRTALSSSGTPRFKDFWEGRRLCLPLFKQNISPKVRSQLWSDYIELSTEAKRLKEILDEQSAFAIEQIELAIQSFERDLEHYDLLLSQVQDTGVSFASMTLKGKEEAYQIMQQELLLLNTLASRVNAMRKEVVKTEMRIRIKNKFLERLSLCGDKIFPKRKELIKKVSHEFSADVERFIESHFQDEEFQGVPLYALREEIKDLQSIAKTLTLNTHAFTETRLKLSHCWDKIKDREKERKKETLQKRQIFKQNFDLVMEKIKVFSEACSSGISIENCNKQSAEILDFMRTLELGREEVRSLKDLVFQAKRIPFNQAREQEIEKQNKEKEVEVLRREKINSLKGTLTTLLNTASEMDLVDLTAKRDEIQQQFEEITLAKAEKQIVDRLFKQLKDAIDEKKERALLMLSEDDLKALDQLKAVCEERKQRRQEIKAQLEHYRKLLGGSGFDFEKAMSYREIIEAEKATLEKINASIEEIEEKIDQIES